MLLGHAVRYERDLESHIFKEVLQCFFAELNSQNACHFSCSCSSSDKGMCVLCARIFMRKRLLFHACYFMEKDSQWKKSKKVSHLSMI